MVRWGTFMLERALIKLNKLIEMLENEVKIRKFSRQQKALQSGGEPPDDDSSSEDTEDDSGESSKKKALQSKGSTRPTSSNVINILNSGGVVEMQPT